MRMTALDNIYRAVSRLRNSNGADIHKLTHAERRILQPLYKDGLL